MPKLIRFFHENDKYVGKTHKKKKICFTQEVLLNSSKYLLDNTYSSNRFILSETDFFSMPVDLDISPSK